MRNLMIPMELTYPMRKLGAAQRAAAAIAALAPRRRGVFQAGGCAGFWPLALAGWFDRVYTCEPAPDNFACLAVNVAETPSVRARACAVGDADRSVGLSRPKAQAGLWTVDGDGPIPMTTIDALVGDAPIDAIALDIEGGEAAALHGAARVIATYRPVIWLEWLRNTAALTTWLGAHDYAPPVPGLGADWYSRPA